MAVDNGGLTLAEFTDDLKKRIARHEYPLMPPERRGEMVSDIEEFREGIRDMDDLPERMPKWEWLSQFDAFQMFKARQ